MARRLKTRLNPALPLALASLLVLAIPATASAVSPTAPHQWGISSVPKVNAEYNLASLVGKDHVRYGKRTFGVNLVWGKRKSEWVFRSASPASFTSSTPSGSTVCDYRKRDIDPSEKLALYNTAARAYLKYGSQTWGINLVWSKQPVHQWKVEAGPGGATSLFNTRANDHLVYGKRPQGINLRWLADVKREAAKNAPGATHSASVWMNRQPIVEGYVPFLGQFGGGVNFNAELTRVTNPPSGAPLAFIKPGYTTRDCGKSSAVTILAPGATMTAAQMTTLYGSERPSLRNAIAFLACAATQHNSVSVNIQYELVAARVSPSPTGSPQTLKGPKAQAIGKLLVAKAG